MPSFRLYEKVVNQCIPSLASSRSITVSSAMTRQIKAWSQALPSPLWKLIPKLDWDADMVPMTKWLEGIWNKHRPPEAIRGFWVGVPQLESSTAELTLTGSEIFDPFDDEWASEQDWRIDGVPGTDDLQLSALAAVERTLSELGADRTAMRSGLARVSADDVLGVLYALAMAHTALLTVRSLKQLASQVAAAQTRYFACGTSAGRAIALCEVSKLHGMKVFVQPTRKEWRKAGNKFYADPWSGNLRSLEVYLKQGGDPNAERRMPWDRSDRLTLLAGRGDDNAAMTKLLLKWGARVDTIVMGGATALIRATGKPDVVRALLSAGADVNAADNYGCTALHHAVSTFMPVPESASLLIEAGAKPEVLTSRGLTPLCEMMRCPSHEADYLRKATTIMQLLLKHGADINHQGADGVTPLGITAVVGSYSNGMLLLRYGANPNVRIAKPIIDAWTPEKDRRLPEGGTPLMATIYKSSAFHEALLAAGADPLLRCDSGLTAIDHARLMRSSQWSDSTAVDRVIAAMEARVAGRGGHRV